MPFTFFFFLYRVFLSAGVAALFGGLRYALSAAGKHSLSVDLHGHHRALSSVAKTCGVAGLAIGCLQGERNLISSEMFIGIMVLSFVLSPFRHLHIYLHIPCILSMLYSAFVARPSNIAVSNSILLGLAFFVGASPLSKKFGARFGLSEDDVRSLPIIKTQNKCCKIAGLASSAESWSVVFRISRLVAVRRDKQLV